MDTRSSSSSTLAATADKLATETSPLLTHCDAEDAHPPSSPETHALLHRRELRKKVIYTMPALAIGIFLSAADQTIVVSSYGRIGSEFSALDRTSWIATTAVIPPPPTPANALA